jgi:hypothetical protein
VVLVGSKNKPTKIDVSLYLGHLSFVRVRATGAKAMPEPTDRLFPNEFKKMFNGLLAENNLKFDRAGQGPHGPGNIRATGPILRKRRSAS